MTERILLVDYENIKAVDLEALPDDVKAGFVLGGKQGTLPAALVVQAQSMGSRFDYVRILSVERNALISVLPFIWASYCTQTHKQSASFSRRTRKVSIRW